MKTATITLAIATALAISGCGEHAEDHAHDAADIDTHVHDDGSTHANHAEETVEAADTHVHEDGTTHADHEEAAPAEGDHAHDETSLGSAMVGEWSVEFAQGHGVVAAGQEGHLVVKLPYNDSGASIVRAWIGTEDRTLSFVGKGEYAPSHDDYDIHALAPDPLPENAKWWVEIENPAGLKVVGSVDPIVD